MADNKNRKAESEDQDIDPRIIELNHKRTSGADLTPDEQEEYHKLSGTEMPENPSNGPQIVDGEILEEEEEE